MNRYLAQFVLPRSEFTINRMTIDAEIRDLQDLNTFFYQVKKMHEGKIKLFLHGEFSLWVTSPREVCLLKNFPVKHLYHRKKSPFPYLGPNITQIGTATFYIGPDILEDNKKVQFLSHLNPSWNGKTT